MAALTPTRRLVKKRGLFKSDLFYKGLAKECGYISEDMAKRFYAGFTRHITRELREHGAVRLPGIGDFALSYQKEKYTISGRIPGVGPTHSVIPGMWLIKFYIDTSWKEYFMRHFANKEKPRL